MRERRFVLGLSVFLVLGVGSGARAHEESTMPPAPEGAAATPAAAPGRAVVGAPPGATPKAARATGGRAAPASPVPTRPLRLTLDANQRLTPTPPPAATAQKGDAEPAPGSANPAAPPPRASEPAGPAEAARKGPVLKLAPSAKEIEGERQTVLKPKVEPRPDQYENQRPDVPAPTQVRRVPGPGSGVGSTAAERKATMLENSGPQQNSTYRRW